MRIAFISDLHSNVPALVAVLADIDAVGVDETICLGDIVDLGPQPSEVVAMLRERGIESICGNHDPLDEGPDFWLLRDIEKWSDEALSPQDRDWLAALPAQVERTVDGVRILGVHGSPRRDTENLFPHTSDQELREILEGVEADVVVAGHTHLPMSRRLGRQLIVNVGSVGLAFEEGFNGAAPRILPWAEYGIISVENGAASVQLRRVPVDVEAYAASVRAAGMPHPKEWLAHWDA
ncbi:MAG: metallophosphoesterase family protein [Proteobacteria bacterium]|nr:metallophosphoesterase family protein [Pseudomonadota bacterium]